MVRFGIYFSHYIKCLKIKDEDIKMYYENNSVNIISYEKNYRIACGFDYKEKLYLINIFCDDGYEYLAYRRLIIRLKDKNGILYKTLLSAIKKIENGGKEYIVSKRVSKERFVSIGIRKYNRLVIRYKLLKKIHYHFILCYYIDTW